MGCRPSVSDQSGARGQKRSPGADHARKLLLSSGQIPDAEKALQRALSKNSQARRYAAAAQETTACQRGHRVGVRTRSACVRERSTGQARCRAVRCAPAARALSCQEQTPGEPSPPCEAEQALPPTAKGPDPTPVGSHCASLRNGLSRSAFASVPGLADLPLAWVAQSFDEAFALADRQPACQPPPKTDGIELRLASCARNPSRQRRRSRQSLPSPASRLIQTIP